MVNVNDGGSAFPSRLVEGMTLRDWFAGQALSALKTEWMELPRSVNKVATHCYFVADAMLAEGEKHNG